jgi:acetyl-CoA carboxylase biotin carboxyl carrier protein
MSWVKRVEAVLDVLKGSNIDEIELVEGELEITLRRSSGNVVAVQAPPLPPNRQYSHQPNTPPPPVSHAQTSAMNAPLTGVYYEASTPAEPPFVKVGDVIKVGQTIAIIEAMKVFSEIASDVSGRVVAIKVKNGDVVKKGDVILQVEPV